MAYIRPELDLDFDEIREWDRLANERMENYKTLYTQETAASLIDMASQYHWVHPEIIATMVLTGNQDLLYPIAIQSAERMGQAGLTPDDRRKADRMLNAVQIQARKRMK